MFKGGGGHGGGGDGRNDGDDGGNGCRGSRNFLSLNMRNSGIKGGRKESNLMNRKKSLIENGDMGRNIKRGERKEGQE